MKTSKFEDRVWQRIPCSAAPRIATGPDGVERLLTFSLIERMFKTCWMRVETVKQRRLVRVFSEAEYQAYWIANMVAGMTPFGARGILDAADLMRQSGEKLRVKHLPLAEQPEAFAQYMWDQYGKDGDSTVRALATALLSPIGMGAYLPLVKELGLPAEATDEEAYALIRTQRELPRDAHLYRQEEMLQRIFLAAYFKAPVQSKIINQLLRDLQADGHTLAAYRSVTK